MDQNMSRMTWKGKIASLKVEAGGNASELRL